MDISVLKSRSSNERAKYKIERALKAIESAQRLLGVASEELCPIVGALDEWRRVNKTYHDVHNLWRYIAYGVLLSTTTKIQGDA